MHKNSQISTHSLNLFLICGSLARIPKTDIPNIVIKRILGMVIFFSPSMWLESQSSNNSESAGVYA